MKPQNHSAILTLTLLALFFILQDTALANPNNHPNLVPQSSRFGSFEPNYAIWQYTEGDDHALEAHYSLLYSLRNGDVLNIFIAYTGEFDFYALDQRESSPVVNRVSNPAVHFRTNNILGIDRSKIPLQWFGAGFEHLSNGQVADANEVVSRPGSPLNGQLVAQVEYDLGNREYFDTISRGSNFISGEALFQMGSYNPSLGDNQDSYSLSLWTKAKIFVSQSGDVTWGPFANTGVKISDYDMLHTELSYNKKWSGGWIREFELGWHYTMGNEGTATDSHDFMLLASVSLKDKRRVPFYFRVHRGPNDVLADYTTSRDSFGFGLLLR